ncbi:MAG: GntP family permease [Planctomycetaceae bacterium]
MASRFAGEFKIMLQAPTGLILVAGLVIVIGGILFVRLHAFAALILAALAVAAMTGTDAIVRSQLLSDSVELNLVALESFSEDETRETAAPIVSTTRKISSAETFRPLPSRGWQADQYRDAQWILRPVEAPNGSSDALHFYELISSDDSSPVQNTAIPFPEESVSGSGASLRIAPTAKFTSAEKLSAQSPIARVTDAFGNAAGKLAILIVAASMIGFCMLESGSADKIVRSAMSLMGERAAPVAFSFSSFLLGIPVFFDTVFLLMIPLARSLFYRTRKNYLLYVLAIVVGATMSHSLVPPTPGPLMIAEQFQVPVTSMIYGGIIVGAFASTCGLLFAFWANRKWELLPPQVDDGTTRQHDPSEDADTSALPSDATTDRRIPSLVESLLPVILPVALMALGTAIRTNDAGDAAIFVFTLPKQILPVLLAVCERNTALILGATIATSTYVRMRQPSRQQLSRGMQASVSSAGTIILVTAAGSAFGKMMQQTSVAELLQQIPAASPVSIVVAAFLVTTAVRTAQGSATVAMMTAAGVFGGLVTSGAAGVAPLYVALAVGCGSKPFSWMNDSGFLVITRMSGMDERQGLRFVTTVMAVAGFGGLLAVILGVCFFPNI